MAVQPFVDLQFWSIVTSLRSDGLRAEEDLVTTDPARDLTAARLGAAIGAVLALGVTAGIVVGGLPWWTAVAFLVYGAPAAVLLWATIVPKVADRLPHGGGQVVELEGAPTPRGRQPEAVRQAG